MKEKNIIEEAGKKYSTKNMLIRKMIKNLISWETEYFGGADKFNAIAESITGLTTRDLDKYGLRSRSKEKEVNYEQMTFTWSEGDVYSLSSENTKEAVAKLNRMIGLIKEKIGENTWGAAQLDAVGITLKEYVTHFDNLKDVDISLTQKHIDEYEQEWLKNAREIAEKKYGGLKPCFREEFIERTNIWNSKYNIEEITRGEYSLSQSVWDKFESLYKYAQERLENDYWFDNTPGYLESLRAKYEI